MFLQIAAEHDGAAPANRESLGRAAEAGNAPTTFPEALRGIRAGRPGRVKDSRLGLCYFFLVGTEGPEDLPSTARVHHAALRRGGLAARAEAQQSQRMRRIGVLMAGNRALPTPV